MSLPTPAARPYYPPDGRYLNLGCGLDIRKGSWVNMDGFLSRPDVLKHDLADLPWPFKDDEFDVVYASHVLEHIPFLYARRNGTHRDILFDVMEEISRVLKPGGILHMRVPYGKSLDIAFGNPQHYRFWTPNWFSFFDPHSKENYYSDARFTVERWHRLASGTRWAHFMKIRGYGLTVHLTVRIPLLKKVLHAGYEMEAFLRNAKGAAPRVAAR